MKINFRNHRKGATKRLPQIFHLKWNLNKSSRPQTFYKKHLQYLGKITGKQPQPAILSKRVSSKRSFLRKIQSFKEHLFCGTSAGNCVYLKEVESCHYFFIHFLKALCYLVIWPARKLSLYHSHKVDGLEGSLDRVLLAAELEYSGYLRTLNRLENQNNCIVFVTSFL